MLKQAKIDLNSAFKSCCLRSQFSVVNLLFDLGFSLQSVSILITNISRYFRFFVKSTLNVFHHTSFFVKILIMVCSIFKIAKMFDISDLPEGWPFGRGLRGLEASE